MKFAFKICSIFMQDAVVISIFFKFLADNQKFLFGFVKINNIFLSGIIPKLDKILDTFFVLISEKVSISFSSRNLNCLIFKKKANKIASLFSCLLIFLKTVLGFGPKINKQEKRLAILLAFF